MRIVGKRNDWKAFLKLVFYVQLYLKRPPQITLLYLKKKVKRKATILCVFIVYSITKKNSKVKKKRTIR